MAAARFGAVTIVVGAGLAVWLEGSTLLAWSPSLLGLLLCLGLYPVFGLLSLQFLLLSPQLLFCGRLLPLFQTRQFLEGATPLLLVVHLRLGHGVQLALQLNLKTNKIITEIEERLAWYDMACKSSDLLLLLKSKLLKKDGKLAIMNFKEASANGKLFMNISKTVF